MTTSVPAETHKPKVAFIGALPPPYMGPTLATEVILNSELSEKFNLIHVDTSDHRELATLGALDLGNIVGALVTYWRLVVCIVRHRPAVVYVPISQTTIGYLKDSGYIIISKLFFRRVVCQLRGGNFKNWLAGASWLTRLYVRVVHGRVTRQIVLGDCLRHLFEDILPADRIDVVPNGKNIDVDAYESAPHDDGIVRVLFLANMMRTKGVMDLLHAAPAVVAEHSNVEFCFAGDWNHADLKAEVDEFVQANKNLPLRFLGKVGAKEKYEAIVNADIFAFPTFYPPEGHPWVLIEAMAFGLPIISTDQGAIRETVIDGENGYIVAKNTPSEVAQRINELASNKDLRVQMGKASREHYHQKFTEAKMVEAMGAAFSRAL